MELLEPWQVLAELVELERVSTSEALSAILQEMASLLIMHLLSEISLLLVLEEDRELLEVSEELVLPL